MSIKRIDSNQPAIVEALRQAGYSVQHIHTIGKGCPDLLIGKNGHNLLFEVKDGNKVASKRRLTDGEVAWIAEWRGQVDVVNGPNEAVELAEMLIRNLEVTL